MTIRRILVLFFVICAAAQPARTDDFQDLYARLAYHGFENLRIGTTADSGFAIAYENRVFRYELKAAGEILALVSRSDTTWRRIHLIPCTRGIARGEITVEGEAYRQFMSGAIDAKAFSRTLTIGEAVDEPGISPGSWKNRSFLKTDIRFNFGHEIQLGQYDDRVKVYGEFQPGLRTQFWHGTLGIVDAFIPFWDEIGVYDSGIRLARASLSQLFRLPRDSYIALQGGIFQPERWGLSVEAAKLWFGRRVMTGAQLDKTGFFFHNQGKWFYSTMERWTYKAYGRYYLPWTDMVVGLDYSKYIYGDKGLRVMLQRTFTEIDLGLYYAVTDYDRFGGVQLRFALPTQRRMRPNWIRVNWPNQYTTGYRATSEATRIEGIMPTGISLDNGFSLIEFVKYLTPTHVMRNVERWRVGAESVR